MTIKIRNFATIRISSTNVAKSRDWYELLFGIRPSEDAPNFASFKIGDTSLDIALADGKSPTSPGGAVGYWLVDDLDQVIARATQLGGEIYRGPLRVDEIRRTIVQIKDPLGNVIGFEAEF